MFELAGVVPPASYQTSSLQQSVGSQCIGLIDFSDRISERHPTSFHFLEILHRFIVSENLGTLRCVCKPTVSQHSKLTTSPQIKFLLLTLKCWYVQVLCLHLSENDLRVLKNRKTLFDSSALKKNFDIRDIELN